MSNNPQTPDRLVAAARRAVHEALVVLPAPEADRVRSLIADLETAVEARTAIRMSDTAVPVPPVTHATVLREAAAYAEGDQLGIHPELDAVRAEIAAGLRRMADEAQQQPAPVTVRELAHALDNSTPYPIELDSQLCQYMAARLLEMLTVHKRPEHAVWQPDEEPPIVQPEPMDPATLATDTVEESRS